MIIYHEMSVQNPEIFWCTDDDSVEWLFTFHTYTLAAFLNLGKNVSVVYIFRVVIDLLL